MRRKSPGTTRLKELSGATMRLGYPRRKHASSAKSCYSPVGYPVLEPSTAGDVSPRPIRIARRAQEESGDQKPPPWPNSTILATRELSRRDVCSRQLLPYDAIADSETLHRKTTLPSPSQESIHRRTEATDKDATA